MSSQVNWAVLRLPRRRPRALAQGDSLSNCGRAESSNAGHGEPVGRISEAAHDFFWIQVSNPKFRKAEWLDPDGDMDLPTAIADAFGTRTEQALIVWKGVPIALYYEEVAEVVTDAMALLSHLASRSSGARLVRLACQSALEADWRCVWEGDELRIEAKWLAVGGLEGVLQSMRPLVVGRRDYMAEWKPLLLKLKEGLLYAGYDEGICPGMRDLDKVIAAIDGAGVLYR